LEINLSGGGNICFCYESGALGDNSEKWGYAVTAVSYD
jgi:hypothetical protein